MAIIGSFRSPSTGNAVTYDEHGNHTDTGIGYTQYTVAQAQPAPTTKTPVSTDTTVAPSTTKMSAEQNSAMLDFWNKNHSNAGNVMAGMTRYNVGAADMAAAIGQTPQQFGNWLRMNGAPEGFAGVTMPQQGAITQGYQDSLNAFLGLKENPQQPAAAPLTTQSPNSWGGGTTIGPAASGTTIGPAASGTTFGPAASGTTFGPAASGTTFGPAASGTTFGPAASGTTFGPAASGTTFGPAASGTTFGPLTSAAGVIQPGQTVGQATAQQNPPMNWGGAAQQQPAFNTPVLDALYQSQQQRMTAPAPTFNFQATAPTAGALTQAIQGV